MIGLGFPLTGAVAALGSSARVAAGSGAMGSELAELGLVVVGVGEEAGVGGAGSVAALGAGAVDAVRARTTTNPTAISKLPPISARAHLRRLGSLPCDASCASPTGTGGATTGGNLGTLGMGVAFGGAWLGLGAPGGGVDPRTLAIETSEILPGGIGSTQVARSECPLRSSDTPRASSQPARSAPSSRMLW